MSFFSEQLVKITIFYSSNEEALYNSHLDTMEKNNGFDLRSWARVPILLLLSCVDLVNLLASDPSLQANHTCFVESLGYKAYGNT